LGETEGFFAYTCAVQRLLAGVPYLREADGGKQKHVADRDRIVEVEGMSTGDCGNSGAIRCSPGGAMLLGSGKTF
jgi:hypothetical protein